VRVAVHVRVALVVGVEGGHRRVLRRRGRANRQVAGQRIDHLDQVVRHQEPADPPAGHREILGERVDDDSVPVGLPTAAGDPGVGDSVVDLVGDQPHPGGRAPGGQARELTRFQHGSGRVRRAGDDQPVQAQVLDHVHRRLVAGVRPALQVDDLAAQGVQNVPVGRVTRPGQPDPAADVEGGEKGEQESARRPGGHDDVVGAHGHPVPVPVVPGDRAAQRLDAGRLGVTENVTVNPGVRGPPHRLRRGG